MKVASAIVKCLEHEKITTVFGYPGGAVLPLYEEIRKSEIEHVLVRNEQSAVHYASGYARKAGTVGVCIATSGPGATNLITGIATAYMDSIPVVIITGQVNSTLIGTDAFQEADIIGASEPFTKHSYLVKDTDNIEAVFKQAFYIAASGRPGPVLIDIPKDIQEKKIKFKYPKDVKIVGYNPTVQGHKGQIKRMITRIRRAERPLIFAGGGVLSANASELLSEFVNKTKIPVVNSLMGLGCFSHESPYYVGLIGSHGECYANEIFTKSDLVIVIGARMSNRAMHKFEALNPEMDIIHIDIDPAEIGKNLWATIPVVGDARNILTELVGSTIEIDTSGWLSEIYKLKESYVPAVDDNLGDVSPKYFMKNVSERLRANSVLVADVGQNQFWAAKNYPIIESRSFMTSGGLGTMGYSLPAAIGAKFADKNAQVICTIGDGGIQMCLGELAVIGEHRLDIKLVVFKNNRLGMVKELQDNVYGSSKNFGVEFGVEVDFGQIAEAYGIKGFRVENENEVVEAVEAVLSEPGPCLIECIVNPNYGTL